MILIDLSFVPIFIIWTGIIIFLNIQGIIKTKSFWNGINLAISLLLLVVHVPLRNEMLNWNFNIICDMIFLATSISLFLYVNDIETRRKVISEVFENRYKKEEIK